MASILFRAMSAGDHGFYDPLWNKNGNVCMLLGMTIKYAGLRGKEVRVIAEE
jgi:hypothetical protein